MRRRGTPGWNKWKWNAGDWVTWILLGPAVSVLFVIFIAYSFGLVPAVLTLVVCILVDVATFYWNW